MDIKIFAKSVKWGENKMMEVNLKNDLEVVSYIPTMKTKNYGLFKFHNQNRQIKRSNIEKIKKSINKYGLMLNPIIVTKEFYILNGQHRFLACKELGLPIVFIADKNASIDMIHIYNSGLSWDYEDSLNFYVKSGNENYIKINNICKEFKITAWSFLSFYYKFTPFGFEEIKSIFSSGNLIIKDIEIQKANAFLIKLKDFKKYDKYTNRSFISAFKEITEQSKYNHDRMIERFDIAFNRTKRELDNCTKTEQYIDVLTRCIYNHRLETKHQLRYNLAYKKFD